MRPQRRSTIIVVGGALAIASAGYGLGTQVGGGTAVADNSQERSGGRALGFEHGPPPGFADLASKLGVGTNELEQALRDFREQHAGGMRKDLAKELADALGVSPDKVAVALEALHQRHEGRPEERPEGRPEQRHGGRPERGDARAALPLRQLATQLDVTRSELRKAFRELRQHAAERWKQHNEELAQFLADRFGLDPSKVLDALPAAGPPLSSPHRPGLPDHPPAL
jgi:transcriptional regulator with XRE-family HTH domain